MAPVEAESTAPVLEVQDQELEVLEPVRITGYCLQGVTASGEEVREGICAYRPEDIGKTAVIYDARQQIIGIYDILDTGGELIRNGEVIDIWFPTKTDCFRITQEGFVQVVELQGDEQ